MNDTEKMHIFRQACPGMPAYEEGKRAYAKSVRFHANPYPAKDTTERQSIEWDRGWDDAQTESIRKRS